MKAKKDIKKSIGLLASYCPFAINIKPLLDELSELERLARIGSATEKAFENFSSISGIRFHENNESKKGHLIDFLKSRDFYSTKDLLEWSELQQDALAIEAARKGQWHPVEDIIERLEESEGE